MNEILKKDVRDNFRILVDECGFSIKTENDDEEYYTVNYASEDFGVKLETYFRKIYATLYKIGYEKKEINVFNLLDYTYRGTLNAPKEKYFHEERDVQEAFRKPLEHISKVIYNNYNTIRVFFRAANYESRLQELTTYLINTNPNLFKQGPF